MISSSPVKQLGISRRLKPLAASLAYFRVLLAGTRLFHRHSCCLGGAPLLTLCPIWLLSDGRHKIAMNSNRDGSRPLFQ